MDDVILNKAKTIERCVIRVRDLYADKKAVLKTDVDAQDVIILNLQRACEAAIDMAAYVVRLKRLGAPQSSRDFFSFLEKEKIISNEISKSMQSMVGFRNIAIHEYQEINWSIVESIIEKRLEDFLQFSSTLIRFHA